MFVLEAKASIYEFYSSGYYTGVKYIYQGSPYACVDRDIRKAKKYRTLKGAEKGARMDFENYSFQIVECEEGIK